MPEAAADQYGLGQAVLMTEGGMSDSDADVAGLIARGKVLLAESRPDRARDDFAEVIRSGHATPETFLNMALAEAGCGDHARARSLMRDVAQQTPAWDEPWLRLAEDLRQEGDNDAAKSAYAEALDRNPSRREALLGLAALHIQDQDGHAAQPLLLRRLGHDPSCIEAWDLLGLALTLTGDAAAAEAAFAEAQILAPARYEIAVRRADAAIAAGNAQAELTRLDVVANDMPLNPTLPVARSVLLQHLGNLDAAVEALEVATALAPEATLPAVMLAEALVRTPRGSDAIAALRRALALQPDDKRLANNLGAVLMRQHQHAAAAAVLREVRAIHGDDPIGLCNLANVTALLGDQDEALVIARHAVAIAPDSVLSHRAVANVLPYHPNACAAELLHALRALSQHLPRRDEPLFNDPDPSRRLRIGLLSGSLRTHPVGWLTIAGFENLDPRGFELHCLAQSTASDPIAGRFRAIAAGWHEVSQFDDAALARFVRQLGVDILIDLGGYGDSGRMTACADRMAPVQIKWVGMQSHSTGLAEMDWFITDRWETPPGWERLYSERLLRLRDGYVCYSPPPYAPDIAPLPALRNGYVTFGCFNNLAKITPDVIATWCEILHKLPGARMVLKTHQFSDAITRDRIAARFTAHGIDRARIDLRGASPHREFLRQYGDVDIVLDPFPYSGGLTTCEALWMGVPVIALAGEIFAARHSCSHLSNVGLRDWVTTDRDSYINLALERASDLEALRTLREGMRHRVAHSPLIDAARFGQSLGAALRHTWSDWCVRQKDSGI